MGFPPIQDQRAERSTTLIANTGAEEPFDFVKYHHLRTTLANALTREVALAENGDSAKLGIGFRAIEQAIPRLLGGRWRKIYVALGFWDTWLAEAERGFPDNLFLRTAQWAPLARVVADDLLADRDISNAQVLGIADRTNTLNLVRSPRQA